MQVPSPDKRIIQRNTGDTGSNLKASYGLNLLSNRGKVLSSSPFLKAIDTTDDADLDKTIASIVYYNGIPYAAADRLFEPSDTADPTSSWVESASSPLLDANTTDMAVFNNLLLVVKNGETDIAAYAGGGSWNNSWWQTTVGETALTGGKKTVLKVGPNNVLYIAEGAQKIVAVDSDLNVSRSGGGSLDFSATDYEITCMEPTSNRMFIGVENTTGGNAVVIEWDMGASTLTANNLHPVPSTAVRCIFVYDNIPYAVLANGSIMYFDGSSFVKHPNYQFPTAQTQDATLADDFIHHNGWAIIDNLPHLLVKGGIITTGNGSYSDNTNGKFEMLSGVWCCDPEVGLYMKYAVGGGIDIDYGQPNLESVGALASVRDNKTKILASIGYYYDGSSSRKALVYHDASDSKPTRSFLMTVPTDMERVPDIVEVVHKKISAGDKINIYYRKESEKSTVIDGEWADNKTINTTDITTDLAVGDIGLVTTGTGAGQIMRIAKLESSSSTTVITFTEVNSLVTANTATTIHFQNFRFMGSITGTGEDNKKLTIPNIGRTRQIEVLIEMQQVAGSVVELNNVKIV